MKIGNKEFNKNDTYIFGILNITPDSFYDGGKNNDLDNMLFNAEKMVKDGVDIFDVGGESTRPNHIKISEDEEIERVSKAVKLLKKNFDIPISIDTYKSKVAEFTLNEGADLINDIWGLKYDKNMASVIKKYDVPCVLMQNRDTTIYNDFLADMKNDLLECTQLATKEGIEKDKIILDTGIGFGKTYEQNLITLNNLKYFEDMGYPTLLGTSNKSVIGLTLDTDTSNRLEGTLATTVLAVLNGVNFVRVHNVLENKRTIQMVKSIMAEKKYVRD